jgi:hypothetical protein
MLAPELDRPPVVRVDPALAETAVQRVLSASRPAASVALAANRQRTDAIYPIADAAEREAAFGRLALAEFEALGLAAPIVRAIGEWPLLATQVRIVLLGEARGRLEGGVTAEPGGNHLGIRLEATRFDDPAGLLAWARHTLGHAEDTLDPAFEFVPGWDEAGAGRVGPATQARLHRLWDVSVDARLAADGRLARAPARRRHETVIAADLPGADDRAALAVVARLWDGPRPAFSELLDWAARPGDFLEELCPGQRWLPRPERCPLCGFPSDDVVPPDPPVASHVVADYPEWQPDDGLCGRCTDRYRFAGQLGGRP